MEKKLHKIVELGTAGCDYTGGGIWVAYIPVLIDGEKAELWLSSEDEDCDDPNVVEFTVWNDDWRSQGMAMLMKYFNNGVYVGNKKDSPYASIGRKLQKALNKGFGPHGPFDSVPFETSADDVRKAIMRILKENYDRDLQIKSIKKKNPPSGWDVSYKEFGIELENGEKFTIKIERA